MPVRQAPARPNTQPVAEPRRGAPDDGIARRPPFGGAVCECCVKVSALNPERRLDVPGGASGRVSCAKDTLPQDAAMRLSRTSEEAARRLWAARRFLARARQPHPCKAARQSPPVQACQRVCSAFTLRVSVGEGTRAGAHAALELTESGQLPFLGFTMIRCLVDAGVSVNLRGAGGF